MKIAPVATTILGLLSASMTEARLSTKTTSSTAQVIIHGVHHDLSDQDLVIISESAVAAYNKFSDDSSFALKSLEPAFHFGFLNGAQKSLGDCQYCPNDDSTFVQRAQWGPLGVTDCQYCPYDDITTLSFDSAMQQTMIANLKIISKDDSVVLSTSSKHNDFVYDFCDRLATSGSANLANAHHCSITFVEDPTISMTYNSDKSAQGFLSMTSVPKELSINDAAIIENAAVETYNAAWKKLGYTIDSFHVREAVPSSQMGSTTTVALIDVQKVADCQYCPYDDNFSKEGLAPAEAAFFNSLFSKALCAKLRKSGSANLASVGDCTLHFFKEHVGASA